MRNPLRGRSSKPDPNWWLKLKRESRGSSDQPELSSLFLPSVFERMRFYQHQDRLWGLVFYSLELVTILTTASIPAVVALGGSAHVTAVLGAMATAFVGLRQLLRPGPTWARVGETHVRLEHELVAWSTGDSKYQDDKTANSNLVREVERISSEEMSDWAQHVVPQAQDGRQSTDNDHDKWTRESVPRTEPGSGASPVSS
jgi:hypothetical protein